MNYPGLDKDSFLSRIGRMVIGEVVDKNFNGEKKKVAMKGIQTGSVPIAAGYLIKLGATLVDQEIDTDVALFLGIGVNALVQMGKNYLKHRGR